jgi:hypothetical protein
LASVALSLFPGLFPVRQDRLDPAVSARIAGGVRAGCRSAPPPLRVAALIRALLLLTFDLDRPTRGLIPVPDKPLVELRAEMALRPAASAPDVP